MRKIVSEIPTELLELLLVELNGYGIEILEKGKNTVKFAIYSEDTEEESIKSSLQTIFEDIGGGKILEESFIKEENWEEKWKENIEPIVVEPFLILPEWELETKENLIPIRIKVGMAFGTGLHPTTQMILKLLPKYLKDEYTVLDIGTGSGILAIASAKLGAKKVKAIDIDKDAVEECKYNSWENEVNVECELNSPENIKGKYDLALANLEIKIFRKILNNIIPLFDKYLIISGIFGDKEKSEIENSVNGYKDLEIVEIVEKTENKSLKDKWFAFVIKRK